MSAEETYPNHGGEAGASTLPQILYRQCARKTVQQILPGLLLFGLALLVFTPAFHAGFLWGDDQLLTQNPQVQSPSGWWTLWIQPRTANYFPLTSTTLWIEYHLGQVLPPDPGRNLWNIDFLRSQAEAGNFWNGYHVTNVLFHAMVVLLTWQTLKCLAFPAPGWRRPFLPYTRSAWIQWHGSRDGRT
jgi:hypothetical protein